jgi:hypothetical protein
MHEPTRTLADFEVSALLSEYRRRAGELTPAEMAHAISLMRKSRESASVARTVKKSARATAAGPSGDDLMADLDNFLKG